MKDNQIIAIQRSIRIFEGMLQSANNNKVYLIAFNRKLKADEITKRIEELTEQIQALNDLLTEGNKERQTLEAIKDYILNTDDEFDEVGNKIYGMVADCIDNEEDEDEKL